MQTEGTNDKVIAVAGANGDLGSRIISELVRLGVKPRALVRKGSTASFPGAETVMVDYNDPASLLSACSGVHCVVSALSGLREVIVDAQTALLNAAVEAGVPRFIPSDYCIDYTKLPEGSNRNLDLHREFAHRLDAAPIKATSVLNGMFTDLLLKEAPLIQAGWKRVLYWGNADQLLDFTTIDNTAAFTSRAALDENTPRYLRIAGDVVNSRDLAEAASRATGHRFKLTRVGGLGLFKAMITITKKLSPQPKEVFPPWQGMQYLHNMYTGMPKLHPLDNDRYPDMQWTTVEDVLRTGLKKNSIKYGPRKRANLLHKTAKMEGTVRANIKPGMLVNIILKKDQRTGVLTEGVVKNILTSAPKHHRGIKVRLEDGQIGRVQEILEEEID